jgi:hypothetical protein
MSDEPAKKANTDNTQNQTSGLGIERERMRDAAEHVREAAEILSNVLDKIRDARNVLYELDFPKPEQWSWYCAKGGVSKAEEELRRIEEDLIRCARDLALSPRDDA